MTTASNTGDPASQSQESGTSPADVRGEAQQEARKEAQQEAGGTVLEGIRGKVFLDRYARKGEDGTPLEQYPEQMWRRVAAGIAAVEPTPEKQAEWTERFYGLLRAFKFVPGGRILSGAGTGHQVTYYNCYVVGLGEDPLDPDAPRYPRLDPPAARPAFFTALGQMTDIMSRSGGVGINLSALPPRGTPIAAPGRAANAANAGATVRPTVALSLAHPDVARLLDEKDGPNLSHVDVAVIVPRAFDQALRNDEDWTPRWEDRAGETVRARDLWARLTSDEGRKVGILRPDAEALRIDDSRDAIVSGAAEVAERLYQGQATVVDFSLLRPRGAYIKTVNGTSSGPVAWMYLVDAVARLDDGASPSEKGVIWFGEIASTITGKTIQQGGCFGPDQRIATTRGLLRAVELADLIDAGERVDALTHHGPRPITYSFRNGIKPLFRVTSARGFTVDVTMEHKMGVFRNGRLVTIPLAELEIGDEVVVFLGDNIGGDYVPLTTMPYDRSIMSTRPNAAVQLPDVLDERLAYLLGYMHGDGYVHWGRKVTWTAPKAVKMATADAYPEIRERLASLTREVFGLEPVIEKKVGEACTNVALYSRVVVDWLESNSLLKAHSEDVRVPEAVFRSPSSVMAAFVAGYFDADGSDRGRKGGYGFDSVSLEMLHDIQQLLAANGILSHIHTTDRSAQGWRTIHRLLVTGAEFKERMTSFIAMAHKNRGREGFRNHGNGYSRDVWPELGVPGRYYQGLWDSTKPHISYHALTRVQDRLVVKGEITLAERIERLLHTVPDHITAIEPLGLSEVYDFEVDDVHMLSGNGFYTSNSRRGALMLMLDDDHPDVEEFIAAKRIGPDGRPVMIEHANMSLCVSDRFMEAVKADLPWDLVWQGRVVRTIRARDMWDRICTAAWTTAEPGVVFMERYQDRSNTYYFENIRCVNPCFPADARLYTGSGVYTFGELAALGSAVPVVAPDGLVKQATHVFQTGHREVFRLTTNEGYTVRLTADHRVLTPAGLVEARDLASGDEVLLLDAPGAFGPIGMARDGERLARRYAGDRDTDLRDLWRSTREMRAAFLACLFEESETSRDGSLCHRAGGDYEAVRLIQQMLLTLGVRSAIGHAGDAAVLTIRLDDRDALARAAGGLLVASGASVSASREAEPLGDGLGRVHPFAATVARLTSEGYEDVYCLTEPDEALIVVDGIAATQCGEQGLPPGGVCNLGALNLERYVDDEGRLLEDDLARDAAYATRFLDDVIDATPYFSELHVQMQRDGTRRTGLGTMGLADALIRMEVGYGSPASLETIDRIYRIVRDASYRESVELAREKGPFGRFDREEYLQGWFIGRLPADIQEGIREHGIRNGVLLTQAPTGTTSLLAGVSSGIEPVFDFAMKRVDRTGEHIMYHPLYQQWRDQHPGEERPAFFVGAKDLTPEEHIVVQAKVQEYTDSSISKTANVPNDFTVDNIKDLYMQAYDLGCKGVTCYRDGSRDAVLTSVTERPKETAPAPAPASAQTADDGAAGPATLPDLATVEAMLTVVETDVAAPLASPAIAPATSAPAPARTPVAPAASATPVTTAVQASAAAMDRGVATSGGIAAPGMPTWVLDGRLKRRPNEMPGFTQNVTAPEGKVNITINSDADGPLELFINVGRAGTDIAALAEALGRLISLQLRLPSTMSQEERLRQVANQLRGIGGSRSIGFGKHRVLSLPDAVAQAIYRHLEEHPAPPPAHQPVVPVAQLALLDADDTAYSGSGAGSGYAGSGSESGGSSPTLVAIPATMGGADPIIGATATPIASPAAVVASSPAAGGELAAQSAIGSGVAAGNIAGLTNGKGNGHGLKAVEPAQTLVATATLTGNLCPQCGSSGAYVFEEGCKKCHYCGYSEC